MGQAASGSHHTATWQPKCPKWQPPPDGVVQALLKRLHLGKGRTYGRVHFLESCKLLECLPAFVNAEEVVAAQAAHDKLVAALGTAASPPSCCQHYALPAITSPRPTAALPSRIVEIIVKMLPLTSALMMRSVSSVWSACVAGIGDAHWLSMAEKRIRDWQWLPPSLLGGSPSARDVVEMYVGLNMTRHKLLPGLSEESDEQESASKGLAHSPDEIFEIFDALFEVELDIREAQESGWLPNHLTDHRERLLSRCSEVWRRYRDSAAAKSWHRTSGLGLARLVELQVPPSAASIVACQAEGGILVQAAPGGAWTAKGTAAVFVVALSDDCWAVDWRFREWEEGSYRNRMSVALSMGLMAGGLGSHRKCVERLQQKLIEQMWLTKDDASWLPNGVERDPPNGTVPTMHARNPRETTIFQKPH